MRSLALKPLTIVYEAVITSQGGRRGISPDGL